jgi:hypothetical protein
VVRFQPMNTDEILRQLIEERDRLDVAISALQGNSTKPKKSKRKPMSQEARAKIAAAQKKRWQKAKKAD